MAKTVLRENNKNAQAKKDKLKASQTKKTGKVKTVVLGEPKELPYDFDYSTVRKSVEKNQDERFVTFFVTDKKTDTEVKCVEHIDHLNPTLRKALENAKII